MSFFDLSSSSTTSATSSDRPTSTFYPAVPLTRAHITTSLARSSDNGATIDLSRRELTDLNEEAAEELATIGVQGTSEQCLVTRLALGHNHLATLPMGLALLSHLRYLNLKHNSFTVFPDVLTFMPALDTLDISHNKIKRLPSDPGCLTNLRVFVFSRNKITKIPSYISKFQQLNILKADRNPLQWPPAHIMDMGNSANDPVVMKEFIRRLVKFVEDSDLKAATLSRSVESVLSPQSLPDTNAPMRSAGAWSRFPIDDSQDVSAMDTPHARSFSIDSAHSIDSVSESIPEVGTPPSETNEPPRPPKLHLGILKTYSMASANSQESYLPSPADSCFSTTAAEDEILTSVPVHSRDVSYQSQQSSRRSPVRQEPNGAGVTATKTAMPDLRTAKLNFTKKASPQFPPPIPAHSSSTKHKDEYGSIPSPLSLRQNSGSSSGSHPSTSTRAPAMRFTKSVGHTDAAPSTQPVHSVDYERNSYFNRLSMLPSATISNTLPEPLVHLVESARTILFTVSQVYQAFDQFTIYTVDDRLPTILRKVLDPASADMMQLICALDRFDALSRKVVPPPAACRTVVECCRDTVAAFSTALGVLSLQLKVLANGKDVRYLRQMLLQLHGATAEIAFAWKALAPHLPAIKPWLRSKSCANSSKGTPLSNNTTAAEWSFINSSSASNSSPSRSSPPSSMENHSTTSMFSTLRRPNGEAPRVRTTRRHAGSFSSRDVELGKTLPSYDFVPDLPPLGRGLAALASGGGGPAPRVARRRATAGPTAGAGLTPSSTSRGATAADLPPRWDASHLRDTSRTSASAQTSSSQPSPPLPSRQMTIDLAPSTSSSKSQVDKEALKAVKEAVDVAPAVWDAMDDILAEGLELDPQGNQVSSVDVDGVDEILERARGVTRRLGETIDAMREGVSVDTRLMREDAHIFLKVVVQLSNLIKTHGSKRPVSPSLRMNMAKLTNSTEEFAVLLHVSSFSPTSNAARPYSPMLVPPSMFGPSAGPSSPGVPITPTGLHAAAGLSPSLSRSRSAQAAPTMSRQRSNLNVATVVEPPKSAQPMQGFKVPAVPAMRRVRV